jgi:dolichol-phosphate mannosyltransferase
MANKPKIAVVIPSYKVKRHILQVIAEIPDDVSKIYVVDDCCPENSGLHVQSLNADSRVEVIFHTKNLGVGGATISGYRQALQDEMDIAVKIDGDGQMDARLIPFFIKPILEEKADYVKGNRFFDIALLKGMPWIRLLGNTGLSFINKLASGYWQIMDPTNGYTAIHTVVLAHLPLDKVAKRYFFESDMLFHLGMLRAVAMDIPLSARYNGEKSNMRISHILFSFPLRYTKCFFQRVFYHYLLRDFNLGSFCSLFGGVLSLGGSAFGAWKWYSLSSVGIQASSGTVMFAALPIILGIQFLMSAVQFDIMNTPKAVIHPYLANK